MAAQESGPSTQDDFDTAVVGGGPAGLSAAIVLGRARRRVIVFDEGRPRNYAAHAVHGYLGLDGISPQELRRLGREEAGSYGVKFIDRRVEGATRMAGADEHSSRFLVTTAEQSFTARTLLLATGVVDHTPEIQNFDAFYGTSIHHCPYCDGWEHRDQHLVAFGDGKSAVKLGLSLLTWSPRITVCTNGVPLSSSERELLDAHEVQYLEEPARDFDGEEGRLREVVFESGESLACDALFFSSGQRQRSSLPGMLGCEVDQDGLVRTEGKQCTCVPGLFLAGDADGEVQFSIVAAAEGAIAATAINEALAKADLGMKDKSSDRDE